MWYEVKENDEELDKILQMDVIFGCGRYNPLTKEDYIRLIGNADAKLLYYEDDKWQLYMYVRKSLAENYLVSHRQSLKWDFADTTLKPFQFLPIIASKTKELLTEYGCPMKYLRFTDKTVATATNISSEKGTDATVYKAELKTKWEEEHGTRTQAQTFVKNYYNSIGMDIEFFEGYDLVTLL
jgi:hypothetical protein